MLVKVKNKDFESVVTALIKQSKQLPAELYQSLTWDQGKELAEHLRFTMDTNRLLRQYYLQGLTYRCTLRRSSMRLHVS